MNRYRGLVLIFVLSFGHLALAGRPASAGESAEADLKLVTAILADLKAGKETEARARIAASPEIVRAAFDELLADRVNAKLFDQPAISGNAVQALALLAGAVGPETEVLAGKAEQVARGANPFDSKASGIERALALYCAIEQVRRPDEPSSAIEQRRRAEAALDASRASGSLIATLNVLHWLGLYAFQGGDMFAARRYWSEAADNARRAMHAPTGFSIHRYLSLTYALESDLPNALREAASAEQYIASGALDPKSVKEGAASLYADLVDYSTRVGDQKQAMTFTRRFISFLEAIGAQPMPRAEAFERLGEVYSQAAASDPAGALEARNALMSAAELFATANEPERALINWTAAGVVMIENSDPREARPPLERAHAFASGVKDERSLVGVEYWMGRSFLAEAKADPRNFRAHWDRGVGMLESALGRIQALERSGAQPTELKITVTFWLGRAALDGPESNPRAALGYFRQTFDAAVGGKRVNEAVTCVDLIVRCHAALGDLPAANQAAIEGYDRLVRSKSIDPLNAANSIAVELKRANSQSGARAVPPGLVAFHDHVAESLAGDSEGRQPRARAALILLAAEFADRRMLRDRAQPVVESLLVAGLSGEALQLAGAVMDAWADLGEGLLASEWAARFIALAEQSYDQAVASEREDLAQQLGEGLARAELLRGRTEVVDLWRERARVAQGEAVERFSREGKFGLAVQAARTLGLEYAEAGKPAEARRWLTRALAFAGNIDDVEARAQTIAAQARVELLDRKPEAARGKVRELFQIAARMPAGAAASETMVFPAAADVTYPAPAIAGLLVCGAVFDELAAQSPENPDHGEQAIAAYRLALALHASAPEGTRALLAPASGISGRLVRALALSGRHHEALVELSRAEARATGSATPGNLEQIQKTLPARTALLAFLQTGEGISAVVVANGQVSIRDFDMSLDDAEMLAGRLARLAPAAPRDAPESGFDRFARQARATLVTPLAGNLKGATKILLFDTGTLSRLPARALSGDFQVERVRFSTQVAANAR